MITLHLRRKSVVDILICQSAYLAGRLFADRLGGNRQHHFFLSRCRIFHRGMAGRVTGYLADPSGDYSVPKPFGRADPVGIKSPVQHGGRVDMGLAGSHDYCWVQPVMLP